MTNATAQPLVSILVATYNQSLIVTETIQSIFEQTYKNIEIIISDDCSKDDTQEVLKRLTNGHTQVKLFLQSKNLGITGNYNFLASQASGDLIATFAGDDIMLPKKIELQVAAMLEDSTASFCHHAVYDVEYETKKIRRIVTKSYINNITTPEDVLSDMGIPGSMSVMYRRNMAPTPPFDIRIPTASDWFHIINLAFKGKGIFLSDSLCFYRRDTNYNSKDPTAYEDDFLKTIEFTRDSYKNIRMSVLPATDQALARFALGAGVRRMILGDKEKARDYFRMAKNDARYSFTSFFFIAVSHMPFGASFFRLIKVLYKKFVH